MNTELIKKNWPIVVAFGMMFLVLFLLWLARPQRSAPAPLETGTPTQQPSTTAETLATLTPAGRTPTHPGTLHPGNLRTSAAPTAEITPVPGAVVIPDMTEMQAFFAAPDGSPEGDGSQESPWDLESALGNTGEIGPGSVLWLRGGMYGSGGDTRFTSLLSGSQDRPIIVRQYPGERATINGGILAKGDWTWFWDFEITNSDGNRVTNAANRPPGLYMTGRGQKAINLVVHNTGHPGIGFWEGVGDGGEIYGCIIFGVGTNDTDRDARTRGSAIYAQNKEGTRYIRDVISFRNFSTGMKAYGEEAPVNGFHFEGNISFSNGDRLIFVNSRDFPVERLAIINNYTYRSPDDPDAPVRLGYSDSDQGDALIEGNVFVNGKNEDGAFWVKRFRNLVFQNNVLVSPGVLSTILRAEQAGQIVWDNNQYYGGSFTPFRIDDQEVSFEFWKLLAKFDLNSRYQADRPQGVQVFVRPNLYQAGRGHVAVYNWNMQDRVEVDLSGVLQPGEAFAIYDAQDYFGQPVAQGVYDGQAVSVPMNLNGVAAIPSASLAVSNVHTSPEFGAFVVQKKP